MAREGAATRPAMPSSIAGHSERSCLLDNIAAVFLPCPLRSSDRRATKHRHFLSLRFGLSVLQFLSREPSRPPLLLDDGAHESLHQCPRNPLPVTTFLDLPPAFPQQITLAKKYAASLAIKPGHAIRISGGNVGCEGVAYNMSRNKLLLATDFFSWGLTCKHAGSIETQLLRSRSWYGRKTVELALMRSNGTLLGGSMDDGH